MPTLLMDLPLAVRGPQHQIRPRIACAIPSPVAVVDVPVAFNCKRLVADDTFALRLQAKFPPALSAAGWLYPLTLSACCTVEFPRRVLRVGCALDLEVSSEGCLVRLGQAQRRDFARPLQPRAAAHLAPVRAWVVLLRHPRGGLLPVSASRPAPERLTALPVHPPKRPPTRSVPLLVCPPANARIELHSHVSGARL